MNRLHIATRGISSWRECLKEPEAQWKRRYSAFEAAVSWELAARDASCLPAPIEGLFRQSGYHDPQLILAVAEHKVDLPGGNAASQSDVWAVVHTVRGMVSLTVEAKAKEKFGDEKLGQWLTAGTSEKSEANRKARWKHVGAHLPAADSYLDVPFQILHRCAAAVIEAKRLGFTHAAFIVQAFETPEASFLDYAAFCRAMNIPAARGGIAATSVDAISLSVGWADCSLASDQDVAAVV